MERTHTVNESRCKKSDQKEEMNHAVHTFDRSWVMIPGVALAHVRLHVFQCSRGSPLPLQAAEGVSESATD